MLGRSLVAVLLGLPAAIALVGALALLGPGTLQARALPMLLLFVPVWVGAICLAFALRTTARAALCLSVICATGFGLQFLAKASGYVVLP